VNPVNQRDREGKDVGRSEGVAVEGQAKYFTVKYYGLLNKRTIDPGFNGSATGSADGLPTSCVLSGRSPEHREPFRLTLEETTNGHILLCGDNPQSPECVGGNADAHHARYARLGEFSP